MHRQLTLPKPSQRLITGRAWPAPRLTGASTRRPLIRKHP